MAAAQTAPASNGQITRDSNLPRSSAEYARNSQSRRSSPVNAIDVTLPIQMAMIPGVCGNIAADRVTRSNNAGTKSTSRNTTMGHESASTRAQSTSGAANRPGYAHADQADRGSIDPQRAAIHIA